MQGTPIRCARAACWFLVLAGTAATQTPLGDEAAALAHLARGRVAQAAASYLALAEAEAARPGPDAGAAALVEYFTAEGLSLAGACPDPAALRGRALALGRAPLVQHHPALADRLSVLALQAALADGSAEAPVLAKDAGCMLSWWIAGPFDNERGGGFARAFEPEQGLDLQAVMTGKQRPVSWRRLDLPPTTAGLFELDAVLRPNSQVLAYAAAVLIADREGEVALRLSTTGAFRVRCNGAEVAAREVERRLYLDQDAVALALRPGPNLLLLKLCHEQGSEFRFAARLRRPDGGPLTGVRVSTAPEDLAAAATTAPRSPTGVQVMEGARTTLAQGAAAGDAGAAFRLARLLLANDADGEGERRDRGLAEAAVAAMPAEPAAAYLLAETRHRRAHLAAERDENARRHDLHAVLALDPDHVPALLALGQLDLESTGMARTAEQRTARALAIAGGDSEPAALLMADVLLARGLGVLVPPHLEQAAATPFGRRRLAESLEEHGSLARALLVRRELCGGGGSLGDRLALAQLLLRRGAADLALTELQAIAARWPLNRAARDTAARLYRARGDHGKALGELARWLEVCPDDDDALLAMATLHGEAGDQQEQIEALQAALDLNPNLRDARRYLEYLAAEREPFYTPFRIDGTAALAADPGPPADAALARDPLHYVLRQRVVEAHRNGTASEYHQMVVRVLNEEGARALSRLRLPFYPGEQRARWLQAAVHKADGSVQHPTLRGSTVSLPSLRPGDVVLAEGRIDGLSPTFFGDYFGLEHHFAPDQGVPAARSVLQVIAEPGRSYRWQSKNGAPEPQRETRPDGTLVLHWELRDLPRDRPEPRRPDLREDAPLCRVTTWRDWDHFAGWWWNLIRRQIEVTPGIRQKVKELTDGLTLEQDRIAALYRFVTTDVRYEAWEFGVHGYKPYSTAVIYERRHGDCKDKALLLCAMLGEIGVAAAPVLIFANPLRSNDDLELPLVHHFNHCIVWLAAKGERPAAFLDGTAQWHPTDTLPEMDQGADVLVVDQGRAQLLSVPWCAPQDNAEQEELDLVLALDGSAVGRLLQRPRGNAAVGVRAQLAQEPARRRETMERALVARFGRVELRDLEASDPSDPASPVQVTARFDVGAAAVPKDHGLVLKSTFQREDLQLLAASPERVAPLLLGIPSRDHRMLRYQMPAGLRPAELPTAVRLETGFGSFTMSWRAQGDRLLVERELVLRAPRVLPEDYREFRDFAKTVADADGRLIVLRREGGR